MDRLVISALESGDDDVEVVERKGLGHPDTICDALAETLSRDLCREYRRQFGQILITTSTRRCWSAGAPPRRFGGGAILAPINIYLAGRAISEVGR